MGKRVSQVNGYVTLHPVLRVVRAEEVKEHPFFRDMDWQLVYLQVS